MHACVTCGRAACCPHVCLTPNPLILHACESASAFDQTITSWTSHHASQSLVATQALFPDNSYSHDSGGDPEVIPQLTFEQFQDFHARYYHPSNGRFWFYGDDDATKRLQILDAYLR
jgi:hypothetical protein